MGAAVRHRAINSCAYTSVPYRAAQMLNQLRHGHRAWPMFELKSGAAMAAPAAPMPPPLYWDRDKDTHETSCHVWSTFFALQTSSG